MNAVNLQEQQAILAGAAQELSMLQASFTAAMRHFASAVSVVTVEHQGQRSGFTATSVSSFCASPPTVLISTKQTSSSAQLLQGAKRFAVNLLAPEHQAIAQRFTGFRGETGEERYAKAQWLEHEDGGAPVLADSLVALDCEADEILERHGHLLIFGRVCAIHAPAQVVQQSPLIYWQGQYRQLGAVL